MKDPFKIFNVNEFKKWMQDATDAEQSLGRPVVSRISLKKLRSVCEVLDSRKAILEFHKNGGLLSEEEPNNMVVIKTNKGSIRINKTYTMFN